jgi:pimeloyl-ACP methyl ester carboxylesterase
MYLNGQTDRAQVQRQVEAAMAAAGIRHRDPVMLTGHSQGGIIAASIAANPERDWNIRSVVTAGSPIARIPIPDGVQVMSLEHDQDAVPRLDGRSNPGTATWTTVQDDSDAGNVGDAHSLDSYTNLAERIDASDDAGLAAWRRANQEFLSDGSVERTRVTIERAP